MSGGCLGCLFWLGDPDRSVAPCLLFPGCLLSSIHRCGMRTARQDAPPELRAALARGDVPDVVAHSTLPVAGLQRCAEVLEQVEADLGRHASDLVAQHWPGVEARWRNQELRERAGEALPEPDDDGFGDGDPPALPGGAP